VDQSSTPPGVPSVVTRAKRPEERLRRRSYLKIDYDEKGNGEKVDVGNGNVARIHHCRDVREIHGINNHKDMCFVFDFKNF
tara:strand:- start:438 stop:680 length:243 start_codon:yes stop_codon:yes gene_type:complete